MGSATKCGDQKEGQGDSGNKIHVLSWDEMLMFTKQQTGFYGGDGYEFISSEGTEG